MGKKQPYYEKSMIIDFTELPQTLGFVAFPILWEIYEETHTFPVC